MKPQILVAVGSAMLLLATACEHPTTAGPARSAQFDFMNGPADLPNVVRGDSVLLFVWADVSTDLVIVVNAPAGGVHALRRCGGPFTPEPQPVQTAGELQDVLHQVRLLRDVNIHVYSPIPSPFTGFLDLCQLSPIATGTGTLTSTDNDRHNAGGGANAFGFRAQGSVDLVGGGSARVLAESERLIAPDGTITEILVNNVRLIPQ
jgi:hypothetical protein